MKKSEIINRISKEHMVSKKVASDIFEDILSSIADMVLQKGRLEVRGFGVFKLRRRNGRFTRNPKTGMEIYVDEKYLLSFKPSKKLLKKLNEKV
ncbi:MAG: HU family DNA-binding protein [Aquificaceae bacterium]